MTEIRLENDIHWDGNQVAVWAIAGGKRVYCQIPRATVHAIPMFNDALTREIARDRVEILERLRPTIFAKVARAKVDSIIVEPVDVVTSVGRAA